MKRILLLISLLIFSISLLAQTGTGWAPMRAKMNFNDSTYFTKELRIAGPWRIGSVTVTSTGTELNLLHGALFSTTEANYLQGVTSSIQTQINAKASLASPTFTGLVKLNTDTLATQAYVRSQGGGGGSMIYPGSGIALSTGTGWTTSITNNSTNWNTAYSDRMKWDGGETGLTPSTGRTSLGATTVGSAFFTLSNPSLITFPRINADNTVTARLASELKTDLSLNNVTNESKTTMFTSPTFTGTVTIPTPFTLGAVSVISTGTQLNYLSGTSGTTGTGNLVFSASPTLSGTVALGSGSLTMTGSLAATGSRVLKGWFTDLEITNLPTINGGTLKSALSLTSSDVGLGNVTNESKATMFTSPAFTGSVPTAGGVTMSRVGSGTLNLTAGDTASVALTGVTSEPYALWIVDSDGLNITASVKDSTAVKSGIYRTWIYSVDAKTNVKVKCLW